MSYQPGDKVFAKMKGFSNWPARVNPLPPHVHVPKGKLPIFFYGTHQVSFIHNKAVFPFEKYREKWGKPKANHHFMSAMEEIVSNPDILLLGKDPDAMDFLLSVYPNVGAEPKQSRVISQPSPSSVLSPRSVEDNSMGNEETKSGKVSSPCVTKGSDNDTDLSPSGASDDDDSYPLKTKGKKKRIGASSQPSSKRPTARRQPTKEISSVRSMSKNGTKRSAQQNSCPLVSSGPKRRRQASSSTVDDAEEKASLSSISSINDDEEDPLASWQKADAARRNEIEAKLQELEKRRQREEEKAIRQAKKHISKSKQHNLRKYADRRSTSPRPTSSQSADPVKSETETEGITAHPVSSPPASSVTSDSESTVQQSRESREARRMAKRLMKKEAKREAKKADKQKAKRLAKALKKQQQMQQLAKQEEHENIVKDEYTRLNTVLEDEVTAASDNTLEVSVDNTTTCTPVVKNGGEAPAIQVKAIPRDFDSSPTERSPNSSSPLANSPHSATSCGSSKHRRLSYSRSPELMSSHLAPAEEAAQSDNQATPTAITPFLQSQKQPSPALDQNKPSGKSLVIKTPPSPTDVQSPILSTTPYDESDNGIGSGHRRHRDQLSSHRKRRLIKFSSASSQSEEEENRSSDEDIEKHPPQPRHHGKLFRTDGHIGNDGSGGATETREHSQRTVNGSMERKRVSTPDCLQQLRNLNRQLKASLLRGHDDHANALAIFDQICAVPATLVQLTQASDLTDCVKKCRRYKLSAEVRDKAQQVLAHFQSIQAAASPEEVQQAVAIVAERVKQAKILQASNAPMNQDENSQGSPAVVATSNVSQAQGNTGTPAADAAPRPISPTRYWEEKRASIKAELDERANSVLSMIRATDERVAAASTISATSPAGFKRPSYSYDPPVSTTSVDAGMEDDATVISRVDEIASYFEANAWLSRRSTNSSKAPRGKHSVSGGAATPPPPPPPLTQLTASMSAPSQSDADLDLDTRIRRMIDSSGNSLAVPPHPKDGQSVARHHQRHHVRNGSVSSPLPPPPPPPPPLSSLRSQSLLPAIDTTQEQPKSRISALPADLLAKRELIVSKVAAKRAADRVAAAAAGAIGGVLSSKQTLSASTGVMIESLSKIPLPPSPPVTGKTAAVTGNMALANGDDDDSDIYDLLGV